MSKLAMKQGATVPSNITQSKICLGACLWRIFLVALVWDMATMLLCQVPGGFLARLSVLKLGASQANWQGQSL